ncbi:hypothetical protein [Pelomicrobium sp. G1]|uniref:hypothetical protein n=1 Tax=Pelomicrobium sp. G1 TaxID=3452920 RepID=UPI003F763246
MRYRLSQKRRNFLKTVGLGAGAAVAGATGGALLPAGTLPALMKEVHAAKVSKLDEFYAQIGKYILLTPGKFTGTVAAHDLATGKTLAWLSGWNYGDTNPIMHHMAAFPSPDPYKGFEFIGNL